MKLTDTVDRLLEFAEQAPFTFSKSGWLDSQTERRIKRGLANLEDDYPVKRLAALLKETDAFVHTGTERELAAAEPDKLDTNDAAALRRRLFESWSVRLCPPAVASHFAAWVGMRPGYLATINAYRVPEVEPKDFPAMLQHKTFEVVDKFVGEVQWLIADLVAAESAHSEPIDLKPFARLLANDVSDIKQRYRAQLDVSNTDLIDPLGVEPEKTTVQFLRMYAESVLRPLNCSWTTYDGTLVVKNHPTDYTVGREDVDYSPPE